MGDGERIVRTMGSTLILPQLLGALGTIFTAAGLGEVISQVMGSMIPEGSFSSVLLRTVWVWLYSR